jgi:hypothetical protein
MTNRLHLSLVVAATTAVLTVFGFAGYQVNAEPGVRFLLEAELVSLRAGDRCFEFAYEPNDCTTCMTGEQCDNPHTDSGSCSTYVNEFDCKECIATSDVSCGGELRLYLDEDNCAANSFMGPLGDCGRLYDQAVEQTCSGTCPMP